MNIDEILDFDILTDEDDTEDETGQQTQAETPEDKFENKVEQLSEPIKQDAQSTEQIHLKISGYRKRIVTYWGNNNQYDKEEMFLSTSLTIPATGADDWTQKAEALQGHIQNSLKSELDRQEKALPTKGT